eukprot:TRINITY_DN10366_c0_g1_i1.p1 TRINITY_DN10366_c0_g1~~TRINITY_DN10366_c0_g1_i1.p1  ORF type:complete len:674 (-),score=156.32 TRINITY_DN10366_c0_g1_i1:142-2163(-)
MDDRHELGHLRSRLQSLTQQNETILREKTELQKERSKLQQDLDEFSTKTLNLLSQVLQERVLFDSKLSSLKNALDQKDHHIQELNQKIDHLTDDYEQEKELLYQNVKIKFLSMKAEQAELLQRSERNRSIEQTLREDIKKKDDELEDLRVEVTQLRNKISAIVRESTNLSLPPPKPTRPPSSNSLTLLESFSESGGRGGSHIGSSSGGQEEILEGQVLFVKTNLPKGGGCVYLVKGGTLVGLVDHLTGDSYHDPEFEAVFLLTYQSFVPTFDLLELLLKRFSFVSSGNGNRNQGLASSTSSLSSSSSEETSKSVDIVKLRVQNILKRVLTLHSSDFDDETTKRKLMDLINAIGLKSKLAGLAARVLNSSSQPKNSQFSTSVRLGSSSPNNKNNTPNVTADNNNNIILGRPIEGSHFMNFNTKQLARRLTAIESDLYRRILPRECFQQPWNRKDPVDAEKGAPNICRLLKHSLRVTNWAASEILNCSLPGQRVRSVKKFIKLAQRMLELHNFQGLFEIMTALLSPSIFRLKQTWAPIELDLPVFVKYREMVDLISPALNYVHYRTALQHSRLPCVPYLGVFLVDLSLVELTHNDFLTGKDENNTNIVPFVNFDKRRHLAVVVRSMRLYQTPYYFPDQLLQKSQEIATFLKGIEELSYFVKDDSRLMSLSTQLEK